MDDLSTCSSELLNTAKSEHVESRNVTPPMSVESGKIPYVAVRDVLFVVLYWEITGKITKCGVCCYAGGHDVFIDS